MKSGMVYFLTIRNTYGPGYKLTGVFLDIPGVETAKLLLLDEGVDEDRIGIEQAPIGILDREGVDRPFEPGPVH